MENALRMRGYKETLDHRDYRALVEGKVSFAEVDEELKRKCAAGTAIPTTQTTISQPTNCSL